MNVMNLINTNRVRDHLRSAFTPLASALALGTWLAAGTAMAAPANDNFADAIALTGALAGQTGSVVTGTQTGTVNVDATSESGETLNHGMNKTVWFKWTCPADGSLTVSTLGSTTPVPAEWDAVLGIYTGAAVNALTTLGGPQDSVYQEVMTVAVTSGTTYSIQVGGYNDEAAANILLSWNFVATVYLADMEGFGLGATIGPVVANAAAITWTVPDGSNLATLWPTIVPSPGATCTVGGSPVVSGDTIDFSGGPVDFTVTSSGGLIVNVYTVTVFVAPGGTWTYSPWTGDANSGIIFASPYTMAVNCAGTATNVNGVPFQASATSGTNFSIGGGVANFTGATPNITGGSLSLANSFIYNGNPRTVTLTNLTLGETYETILFSFGWEGSGRTQTFTSGGDSIVLDQDLYGNQQGIRIAYTFVADAASKELTIAPVGGAGTFHMSALANRQVSAPVPEAKITSFGPGATIGPVAANLADILWAVPVGSNLAALAPTFVLSPGATCTVGGFPAVSSETRDFTSPVHYIVKASDFATSGTTTDYTVTVRIAYDLDWDVAGGGDWDLSTVNWLKVPSGPASTFANNDEVTFNKVEGGTISIPSTVLPAATTVGAAAGDYTFSGEPIGGTGSLTMEGSGILTLSSPNTYSGATVVNSGTLQVNGNSAIGGSTSFSVADGATMLLSGTNPWPVNAATLTGAGAVTVPAPGQGNVAFKFDMSAFTGVLNLVGGQFSVNPYFSPGFVAPVNGTINIENGTVLYLGWQGTTFTTNVKLSGGTDNGEGYGVLRGDTATLNGAVILATNSTIGSAGGTLTINAVISDEGNGYGFTTVGSINTTVILTAENTYTGQTTVNGGTTLRCDAPNSLGNGALSINGKANLNYSGTKAVDSLTLGGVAQTVSGTYGSVASGATFQNDTYFAGTGTVTVMAASGFATWASANAPGQTPDQDHDNDGVDNGIEYFMGESGSSFTAMPGLDGTNTVTWTKDPAYDGTWQVQTSPDLSAWTNVAGTDNGTSVSYTLPSGLGKRFVRLLVTPTL